MDQCSVLVPAPRRPALWHTVVDGSVKTSFILLARSTSCRFEHICKCRPAFLLSCRFIVAPQMEGQHPFAQIDELPLDGLLNGRQYQVVICEVLLFYYILLITIASPRSQTAASTRCRLFVVIDS